MYAWYDYLSSSAPSCFLLKFLDEPGLIWWTIPDLIPGGKKIFSSISLEFPLGHVKRNKSLKPGLLKYHILQNKSKNTFFQFIYIFVRPCNNKKKVQKNQDYSNTIFYRIKIKIFSISSLKFSLDHVKRPNRKSRF